MECLIPRLFTVNITSSEIYWQQAGQLTLEDTSILFHFQNYF